MKRNKKSFCVRIDPDVMEDFRKKYLHLSVSGVLERALIELEQMSREEYLEYTKPPRMN